MDPKQEKPEEEILSALKTPDVGVSPPPPDFLGKSSPPPSPSALDKPSLAPAPDFLGKSTPPPPPIPPVSLEIDDTDPVEEEEGAVGSLAPINTRIIAAVIDGVVAMALHIAIITIMPDVLDRLGMLAGMAYLFTRDSLPFLGGQSIGKKVMKLQAVGTDGKSLSGNWQTGLIRNVSIAVPPFAIVELIVLLIRDTKPERGYRLGDEWAKTKVIVVPFQVPGA